MKETAKDMARGKWKSILPKFGIPLSVLDGKHHPCPAGDAGKPKKDGFRFTDRDGSGSFFCACSTGNRGGAAIIECCRKLPYCDIARDIEKMAGKIEVPETVVADKPDPMKALNKVKLAIVQDIGTVSAYLESRCIPAVPASLRQASLVYWDGTSNIGTFDAMVASVASPDGKLESFHVTYLQDGAKAPVPVPRKVLTPRNTINGASIRLAPAAEIMGIAEGIETALSASILYDLPVWACINQKNLSDFEPPAIVKELYIFGDNDESFTGQSAAYACAKRLKAKGLAVVVMLPQRLGEDWNDVLIEQKKFVQSEESKVTLGRR